MAKWKISCPKITIIRIIYLQLCYQKCLSRIFLPVMLYSRRVTKEFRTFLFFISIRQRDYFLSINFYLFSLLLSALSKR